MSRRMASRIFVLSALLSYGCADHGGDVATTDGANFDADSESDEEPEIAAQTVVRTPESSPRGSASADPPMNECTWSQTQTLLEAYAWALSGVTDAIQKTPTNDPARWNTWFSAGATQAQRNHVATILTDIKDRTLSSQYRCLRQETAGTSEFARCNQIWVRAFVNRPVRIINICPSFFEMSVGWRINTLIHEAAHLSLDQKDHSVDGSAGAAIDLARSNPDIAFQNAANFAHFVTNNVNL